MAVLKKSFYSAFYIAALLFLLAFAFTTYQNMDNWAGCLLALFLVSLALAFRGGQRYIGYWYSVVILAVSTIAMYYPQYFKSVEGKDASFLGSSLASWWHNRPPEDESAKKN